MAIIGRYAMIIPTATGSPLPALPSPVVAAGGMYGSPRLCLSTALVDLIEVLQLLEETKWWRWASWRMWR